MKKQLIVFGIIIVALGAFGAWYASQNASVPAPVVPGDAEKTTPPTPAPGGAPTPTSTPTTPSGNGAAKPPTKGFTMADVSAHATAANCWTAISGNVYDLTKWVNEHPGGAEAILSICGKDGTKAFEGQHGGAPRPERELAKFLIGALR